MSYKDEAIIGQQVRLLYQQTPYANSVIIIVAVLLFWLFSDRVNVSVLTIWSSLISILAVMRLGLWYYHRQQPSAVSADTWIKRHVWLTAAMGIAWGGASTFYFLIDDVQINTLFYVLVCGVTTAGVPVLAAWFPAYLAYTLPQVSMLIGVTLHQAQVQPQTQALSLFLIFALLSYYAMLISLARRSHKSIHSELLLKQKNERLVQELNNEVEQREALIDERTQALQMVNRELQQSQQHMLTLSSAVEASPNGILITDANGIIQYVNPRCADILGYPADEVIGKIPQLYGADAASRELYQARWECIQAGCEWDGEFYNQRKNGELYWLKEYIAPIKNSSGQLTHFVAIQEDISEAKILASQLSYQATHDALTGLINRSEFERRLAELVKDAGSTESVHAMCFVDLDQFKVINDTCGHVAGDELLRQLSQLLMASTRKTDTLARLGGDEFAIVMAHCDLQQAEAVAYDLRKLIEQFQFIWESRVFTIGASIGVTAIDQHTADMTAVLKQADTACYAAKNAGRNRVYLYQNNDQHLAEQQGQFHWVNEIKQALTEDRFELFAQPILSVANEQADVFEVLLRLRSEQGELSQPSAFLPAAERYNLSDKVDRWVMDKVFCWLEQHEKDLPELKQLAINLSGATLADGEMLAYLSERMRQAAFNTRRLKFELTETAAIGNLRQAKLFMQTLSELGCTFSLDDFGSGLSSFAYLKNLPVHSIKIDGMFVKDMLEDPLDFEMVKAISDIGHVMGLETIAEFVENEEIWEKLKLIGVDYGQGYHLGKPMPIDHILQHDIRMKSAGNKG